MSARVFSARVSFVYAFLFLGWGVQLPFLPLWLGAKGLDTTQIAIALAAFIAIRIVATPLGTFLADRRGEQLAIVRVLTAACSAAFVIMGFFDGFVPILVIGMLGSACFAPVGPLVESFAIDASQRLGIDYGRMRLWGSVSFILGSIISGLALEYVDTSQVVFLIAGAQGLLALATWALPPRPPRPSPHAHAAPVNFRDVARLLHTGSFVVFLAAVSLAQASHALFYSFGSLHWEMLGYSKAMIGTLWGVGVTAEVLLFFVASAAVRRIDAERLVLIGCIGGFVRWTVTAFDPALWILLPLQALHALSFAMTHLGTMYFIQRAIPAQLKNSAVGLYSALSGGAAMMIATSASGPLYRELGGHAYLVMAAMSLAATGLALRFRRISPTEPQAPGA